MLQTRQACPVLAPGTDDEGRLQSVGLVRRKGARLRVSRAGRQELLSLPAASGVGEGELRSLFAGEELRIMLFNYREMGIIPKVEPM